MSAAPSSGEASHAHMWAETTHGRVAAVRHFGAFSVFDIEAPRLAAKAAPGQFLMVTVPDGAFFLRRPISLFTVRGGQVGLLIETRGAGTERLARVEVGETLAVAGPLGNEFPIEGVRSALLVGGGIGCAPLQYLGDALRADGARVAAAFGFRDLHAARLAEAFALDPLHVATDDGSAGRHGTVVDVLETLEVPAGTVVYACGPTGMVTAVKRWSAARGLRGYASLEAHMACGTGACHGCVVDTAKGRARVCSEGPVFVLDEVLS